MPLVHERTFRIRQYECDANGRVNQANYARFMQETALDASAAAGYDIARYAAMHRLWLIRETDIAFQRPLNYGDTVIVNTWVQDFRRVRSRRAYQFHLAASGLKVAEAYTDWIYLDTESLRPASVPQEMILAFIPEGIPRQAPRRKKFPLMPSPPPGLFTMQRTVEWQEIDAAGHVNNAVYLAYIEDCEARVMAEFGWPLARIFEQGLGIVVRRYHIEYLQSALLGDIVELATFVSDVTPTTAVRHYTITRNSNQTLLARARVLWGWVNLSTGKEVHFLPAFLANLAPNIA